MTALRICPLQALAHEVSAFRPDYVLSISDDDETRRTSGHILAVAGVPHYDLQFHDIDRVLPGFTGASVPMMRDMLAAVDSDLPEAPTRLLVHCHAGLSRSPAVAMLALAHFLAAGGVFDGRTALEIAAKVFAACPQVIPNARVIRIGRKLFGPNGALMAREPWARDARDAVHAKAIW